jgi:hypothetical protein
LTISKISVAAAALCAKRKRLGMTVELIHLATKNFDCAAGPTNRVNPLPVRLPDFVTSGGTHTRTITRPPPFTLNNFGGSTPSSVTNEQ